MRRAFRTVATDTTNSRCGFAVKVYTDEGNWDLVGNNIPIFIIQDAMKFPDHRCDLWEAIEAGAGNASTH